MRHPLEITKANARLERGVLVLLLLICFLPCFCFAEGSSREANADPCGERGKHIFAHLGYPESFRQEIHFDSNYDRFKKKFDEAGANPVSIVIPGLTRRGKTNLIMQLREDHLKNGQPALFLDAWGSSPEGMLASLRAEVHRHQPPFPENLIASVDQADNFFSALTFLSKHAQAQGHPLLLSVDEAGYMIDTKTWGDFHRRLLASQNLQLVVVYAARNREALRNVRRFIERDDPNHSAQTFELRPETKEEVKKYLAQFEAANHNTYTPDAIERLYELSRGWPFELNILIDQVPRDLKTVTRKDIDEAYRIARASYGGQARFQDPDYPGGD